MRAHPLRPPYLALLFAAGSSLTPALRAQTATVPANYHGPTVVGFCFYTEANNVSYAGPITISNYFRFDAERAFHQYVASHAPSGQNITCRWTNQQQYAAAADKGFHATDRTGHPLAAKQTGWRYTPGAGGMSNAASASAPAGSTTANGAAATGSTTPVSPGASIAQSANSSKQAITASGASSVTDTMSSATNSVTSAMQGGVGRMFHKKSSTADATSPNTSPQAGAPAANDLASNPASNVVPPTDDSNPGFATIPVTSGNPADASGPSFVFCHLKAAGSVYVSDIFPSTDASDAGAAMSFWRQVGRQYKLSSIPFRDNVACVRSPAEQPAISSRQTLMSAGTAGKTVDTGWTYMGDATK